MKKLSLFALCGTLFCIASSNSAFAIHSDTCSAQAGSVVIHPGANNQNCSTTAPGACVGYNNGSAINNSTSNAFVVGKGCCCWN